MKDGLKDGLVEEKKNIETEKIKLDKLFSVIAGCRLVAFLAAVIFMFTSIKYKSFLPFSAFVISVIVFVFLVKYHAGIDEKILALKAKSTVINRYLMRFGDEWKKFKDDGSDFLKKNSTPLIAYDLDILGPSSLFQLINVAHTDEGRKKLADSLTFARDTSLGISERYDAITELSGKKDFMLDFESTSERIVQRREKEALRNNSDNENVDSQDNENKTDDTQNSEKTSESFPFWMYLFMIIIPVINIVMIALVLSKGLNPGRILITFVAGLILTWGPQSLIESFTSSVTKYGSVAGDYYKLLSLIGNEEFKSDLLKSIHERVKGHDGLLAAIKKLGTIGSFNNISFNPIIHMVLSGFLGWDYYIALAAYKWSRKNGNVFEESIDIISDIEELQSLAVLPVIRETTRPEIVYSKDPELSMKDIYHPLLESESVVSNTSDISGALTVITGSNMSGKTTFLRTIAINMVLAFTGCPVCAKYYRMPYMKIFTSMRVMDDVSGGISTFYAEILRIKEMAEYVESDQDVPALCLIDEIFKGTNSADRIVGAREALTKLSAGNAMVIVTTHDFELCDLTIDKGAVNNYHFEEYYENNTLKFDYKIKDGRCTTRNAMAILKMAGLVQI